jgi:hypothetical protein
VNPSSWSDNSGGGVVVLGGDALYNCDNDEDVEKRRFVDCIGGI